MHHQGILNTTEVCPHNQELLQQLHVQGRKQQNQLHGDGMHEIRLLRVGILLQSDH